MKSDAFVAFVAACVVAPVIAQDTASRLAALEREVAEVRQQVEIEAEAARQAVMEDAARQGPFAGYGGGGFFISGEGGNFTLRPYLLLQFRHVTNFGENNGDLGEVESGFEMRRVRFGAKGNAFEDVSYFLLWESVRSGGNTRLLYAFADVPVSDWTVRFGQFKEPGGIEWNTSATRQLAAERSLANNLLSGFNLGFVQGVTAKRQTDEFRFTAGYLDGVGTFNTDFNGGSDLFRDGEWGVTARLDYKPMGDWKDTSDLTALVRRPAEDVLLLSLSANHTRADAGGVTFLAADALAKSADQPIAFLASGYALRLDVDGDHSTNLGGIAQVGYGLTERDELLARVGVTHLESDALDPAGEGIYPEFTAGYNRYFSGHNAKFTLDASYYPSGAPRRVNGAGVEGGGGDQVVIRGQFQLQL